MFYCAYDGNFAISRFNPFEFDEKLIRYGSFYSPVEIIGKNLKSELITYYKKAIVSNDPFIEFISFYHIIEYFFGKNGKEKKNLERVLKRFIILNEFKQELDNSDEDYYNYLLTKKVRFSKKTEYVNEENFHNTLAKRIYALRNSLVHRKEEYKEDKYLPFEKEHREDLRNEILLMRTIANQIILKSSK